LFSSPESDAAGQMRGEPDVIGPKYALRLADLREWHCIEVKCFNCGRVGVSRQAQATAGRPAQAGASVVEAT
jgi:hypothetical protein